MALTAGLTGARGNRSRLLAFASLVVSVSLLSLSGLQSAGAAAAKPDHLAIISITDGDGNTLPSAGGSFVAPAGQTVKYTVQTQDSSNNPAPVSGRTTIYLTENGAGGSFGTAQGSIPSRGTQVTLPISAIYTLTSDTARQDYNVVVTADDDTNPAQAPADETDLLPGWKTGNFVRDFNSFASLGSNSLISAGGGCAKKKGCSAGTARVFSASQTTDPESLCTATATQPTCVIIELNNGAQGFAVLTLSDCDGFGGSGGLTSADCRSLLVSFLADINGLYSNAAPLTMIFKCDSTTCGGGGISGYTIFVDSSNGVPATESQPCAANSHVIPDTLDFCTDYNASHRDNSQDLVLYLLIARDIVGRIH
jgi:hypothetical protein